MKRYKQHTFMLFLLIVFSIFSTRGMAQNYGVTLKFVSPATTQDIDEVASNVLKIVNYTESYQEVVLSISNPNDNWRIIGESNRGYRIAPRDSFFIPVRIIPDKGAKGNTTYITSANISSQGIQLAFTTWSISVEKVSSWFAKVPKKKIYFKSNSDTAWFSVEIHNQGNSEENLILNLSSSRFLMVFDSAGTHPVIEPRYFTLGVNESRYFYFMALRRGRIKLPTDVDDDASLAERDAVKINITYQKSSLKNNRSWNGNIDFIKLFDELQIFKNGHSSIPLAIELNTYNLLNRSSYLTLSMYGHAILPKKRMLTYYFQTPFNSNFFNARSYLGTYHYLGFESDKLNFSIGSVTSGRSFANLSGQGARVEYTYKNHHKFGGLFVRSPKLFNKYYLFGYGLSYTYISKRFFIDNYYQRKDNLYAKINANSYTTYSTIKINQDNTLRLGLGYSNEDHYTIVNNPHLNGYHYRVLYNGHYKKFRYNFVNYYGSKNFSEFRGIFSAAFNTLYALNKTSTISLAGTHLVTNPEYYREGKKVEIDNYSRKDLLSFKYLYNTEEANYIFNPFIQYFDYLQLRTLTESFGIDFRLHNQGSGKLYATAIAGYVNMLDYDSIPSFFVSNLRLTYRYNQFTSNIRYYYGPYFTREQIDYINDAFNPQRLFISLYHDKWFGENKFQLKNNLNLNYTTKNKRALLSTRPELFYYTDNDFRFSIYARFSMYAETPEVRIINEFQDGIGEPTLDSRFEVGFGIKKDLNVPVSFRRYSDLKIVVFKDLNGNHKKDIDEPGLQDMLITIEKTDSTMLDYGNDLTVEAELEKYELVSNRGGKVVFNNLPRGDYHIVLKALRANNTWFDNYDMTTILDHDKTIYIPMSKGTRISGGLFIDREKYSHFKDNINVANIRVTAVDTAGKNYSTLTDAVGNFDFYLPAGKYIITCNESALGDRFKFVKNNILVSLNGGIDNYTISFYIIEKRRVIKVKRFDKKGNVIENSYIDNKATKTSNENERSGSYEIPLNENIINDNESQVPGNTKNTSDSSNTNPVVVSKKVEQIDQKVDRIENKVEEIKTLIDQINPPSNSTGSNNNKSGLNSSSNAKAKDQPQIITKNIVQFPKELVGKIEDGEFYIIIGAFKLPENAISAVNSWQRRYKSYKPLIIHNQKRDWYYVCIETYSSFNSANARNQELKKDRIDSWIYFMDQENNLNKYKN